MRVLLITDLQFQEAGNQLLAHSVLGLTRSGHEVHFLTSNPRPMENSSITHSIERMTIHRFRPVFRGLMPWLQAMIVRKLKSGIQSVKSEEFSERTFDSLYSSGIRRPFTVRNTYNSWVHFGQMLSFYLGALAPALRIVRENKIDLLYGYEVMGTPVAFTIAKARSLPSVTNYQGTFVYPYLGSFGKLFRVGSFALPMLLPVNAIFMLNDGTKGDIVLERFGISKERIHFCLGGVEKSPQEPSLCPEEIKVSLGVPRDALVVLSVNKFKYWKRIDRIVCSFSKVAKRIDRAHLLLVGHGSEEVYLRELAKRLGAGDRIVFAGGVPHNQIHQYYAIADVFMITNDVSNLGLPLLEAMANGRCILSLADGSVDQLLSDGESALLVDPSNLDKILPEALEYLLGNEALRCRLGRQAKSVADNVLKSWEDRADEEVKVMEKVISQFNKQRHQPV